MSYENNHGPTTVSYTITSSMYDYIVRGHGLGALEGPTGDQDLAPAIKEIVQAAHHYLAGGEVEVKIVRRGNPDIVNELDARLDRAAKDANAINQAAGYYVTGLV